MLLPKVEGNAIKELVKWAGNYFRLINNDAVLFNITVFDDF